MTLSSPARAHRHRLRRLAAATAATVAAVAALATASLLLVLAAPAGALAASGVDAASGAPSDRSITLSMSPSAEGVISPGAPLTVTVAAENPTGSTAPAGAVRITMSTTPLTSRAEITAWLAAPEAESPRTDLVLADGAIPGIAARGTSVVAIPIDTAPLAGLAPGVYPLRAEDTSGQGARSAVSVLTVRGDPGTGALGVVVPITAPPLSTGLLTKAQLTTLTAPDGALRAQLDAVTGTAAILAVDPAVVAAIRVLGTSAPASALRWLNDLMDLSNTRFALQFGDADLATQIAAGLGTPLAVQSLAPSLSAADFTGTTGTTATPSPSPTPTSASPTPTPSSTSTPGGSTLPTLDELTDVGAGVGNVYWPATGTAGSEVVAALGGLTVEGVAPITLVGSGAVTTGPSVPAWADAAGSRVLVYEQDASTALRDAAVADDPVARGQALATASAFAALATAAAPDAPLLVAIDRADSYSPAGLRAAVTTAGSLSGRSAGELSAITAGTPAAITLDAVAAAPERVTALTTLLGDETTITSFATILADPEVLTAPERAAVLQLIGNGWLGLPTRAADVFDEHRAQTAKTLDAVAIVPPSDIVLAATSAPLAFSVRNDLPWPVSLVLIAAPGDPRMIVQNTTPVEAGPSQNTRVKVPVEARVGSGESTLHLQLRSPSLVAIGGPVTVHVSVHAEWESVGLVIMVILVAAMIVLGVIRTMRKLRRGGQMPESDAEDAPGDAPEDAHGETPGDGGTDG